MTSTYESAHKRFCDAREEYHRLESELAVARGKMNAAERECSVEWLELLDASRMSPAQRGDAAP